jgi:hypothetical protein
MLLYAGLCLLNIKTKRYHYKKTFTAMGIFPGNKILLSFIIPSVGHIWDLTETTELEIEPMCNSEEGAKLCSPSVQELNTVRNSTWA